MAKVCVIGGSNSLMKNGYVPPMITMLEAALNKPVELYNLSIGGTFSHYGLWQVLSKKKHLDADVIVVEYCLNDSELSSWGMTRHWAQAYEGLLSKLRKDCPKAQIVCPLLLTRSSSVNPSVSSIVTGAHFINARYGVATVDVNNELFAKAPDAYWSIEKEWFRDQSHYSKLVQVLIAEMLVKSILQGDGGAGHSRVFPVSRDHFGDARSAVEDGIFDALFPLGTTYTDYKNTLVNERAAILPEQVPLRFNLKGQLIAFIVVSTRQDGILECRFGEHRIYAGVRRRALDDASHDFLMNILLPDQYFKKTVFRSAEGTALSLRVLPTSEIANLGENEVRTRPTARLPDLTEGFFSLSIVDILYKGEIVPIT